MSTSIFTSPFGAASRIKSSRPGSTLVISLDDSGNKGMAKFINTQITARLESARQFVHAFDDAIYAYTYGDRISEIQASGVAFLSLCGPGVESSQGTGLDDVVEYYDKNKMSKRDTVVNVQIGQWFYRCMLVSCTVEAIAGELQQGRFAFVFAVLSYDRRSK